MQRAKWLLGVLTLSTACSSTALNDSADVARKSAVQTEAGMVQVAGPPWELTQPFVDVRLHLAQPRAVDAAQGAEVPPRAVVLMVTYDSWHWSFKKQALDAEGNELPLLDISVSTNDPRQQMDDLKVVGVALPVQKLDVPEGGSLAVTLVGSPANERIELPDFYVRGCMDRLADSVAGN